jgi:ABC-type taurine transport system substrate-binding protein
VPLARKSGTEIWTDAAKIAEMGFPSMNVLVVSRDLATHDKPLVQKIVCAVATASDDMVGPDRSTYFATSAPLLGVPPDVAIKGSSDWPELTLKQQAEWLGEPGSNVADSKIVQEAFLKSAQFLLQSGRIISVPSTAKIAAAVDPRFVDAALNGACK